MSGLLYIPVLPTRPHAADAYRRLRPDIQNAVAPIWNLPPRSGLPPGALAAAVSRDLALVTKSQRYQPAWLDAPFADESEIPILAELLPLASARGPLRPVTGPGRSEAQQVAALASASRSGDGLGIRVQVPGEWEGDITDAVRDLLERVDPAVPVDLLLDLAAVCAGRRDAGKEALRALDSLVPLIPWRMVAVLGGGFPHVTRDLLDEGVREESRSDWRVWNEISDSGRAYLSMLTYGDYGIQPAAALARAPQSGKGGPPWGVIRYTTDRYFVLGKMLARGAERIAHNRAVTRQVLEHPRFRGPAAGSAEAWLRDCAYGLGSNGTGNFSTWLWVGNAQHMTYVVHSLRT